MQIMFFVVMTYFKLIGLILIYNKGIFFLLFFICFIVRASERKP